MLGYEFQWDRVIHFLIYWRQLVTELKLSD